MKTTKKTDQKKYDMIWVSEGKVMKKIIGAEEGWICKSVCDQWTCGEYLGRGFKLIRETRLSRGIRFYRFNPSMVHGLVIAA